MDSLTGSLDSVSTLATQSALSAWAWGSDFLMVLVLFGLLFLFAWYMGRGPFVALLISLYVGYALYSVFPFMSYAPTSPPLAALATALALYVAGTGIAYLVLRRAVVSDFIYVGLFGLAFLSLLAAGFLIALAYHVFPVASVYTFTPAIDFFFAAKEYFFWWFIAPLIGLFVLAR